MKVMILHKHSNMKALAGKMTMDFQTLNFILVIHLSIYNFNHESASKRDTKVSKLLSHFSNKKLNNFSIISMGLLFSLMEIF